MALNPQSLPHLPKLDKSQFVQAYLQAQKVHAKFHAEQGATFIASWDTIHAHETTPQKPTSHNIGFATPVLIARNPHPTTTNALANTEIKSADPCTHTVQSKNRGDKTNQGDKSRKVVSNKREARSETDEDHAARLAERRERKRIKRAIVQPKPPNELDVVSSDDNDKPKKRAKAPKEKKLKVPAGFALMHGFAATNVGKNRLTMKPLSNVGVFKKGKASFNAKTKPNTKGHKPTQFSESKFLNSNKKAPELHVSDSASDSGSESTLSSVHELLKPNVKASHKSLPEESRGLASELSKVSTSEKHAGPESEIWDIESRASEKRRLLKQNNRLVQEDSTLQMQKSVIVDARIPAWSNRVDKATQKVPIVLAEASEIIAIPSSPSLRPSQSASQIGELRQPPLVNAQTSRFFAPAPRKQATPPPPEPIVTADPPVQDPEPEDHPQLPQSPPPLPVHDSLPHPTSRSHFVVPLRTRIFSQQFVPLYATETCSPESPESDDGHQMPDMNEAPQYFDQGYPATMVSGNSEEMYDQESGLNQVFYPVEDNCSAPDGYMDYAQDRIGESGLASPNLYANQFWANHASDEYIDTVEDGVSKPVYNASEACGEWDYAYDNNYQEDQQAFVSDAGLDPWAEAAVSFLFPVCDGLDFSTGPDLAYDCGGYTAETDAQAYTAEPLDSSGIDPNLPDVTFDCTGSEIDVHTPQFAEGRALLLGFPLHESPNRTFLPPAASIYNAEFDVVKSLRGHWLPQKL
ncbi:hypothetical protein R3P38DRAFT_2830780 [Favolaschia claudopus]|uniref:Uncharacterized protein n=1 Tax=Favolaschia claudopus TaxID=2862362 RepID=A0AAW0E857_9AGAR